MEELTKEIWLLGLLNSRAVFWFYKRISSQIRGGFVRFISQYVSQIPVPFPNKPPPVETLVQTILSKKRADPSSDVSQMEREIDQLVYQLYGLSKEEIAIIEEVQAI